MTIGTADIVFVIAPSGTGKTFSGDYLDAVHGFGHVDGDFQFRHVHRAKCRENTKKMLKAVALFKTTGEWPDGLWNPYIDVQATQTIEAAKDHDKVVFTCAMGFDMMRDYYVKKLVEGGVPRENITILQLTIDPDVKYRGLYHRTLVGLEEAGISIEDTCKSWGWEFEGEMTADKFVDCSKKFNSFFKDNEKHFEDCAHATKIDVSGRDISHCDNLDAALGLSTRAAEWSYERICDTVKPMDEQRAINMAKNGADQIFAEIRAEIQAEINPDAAANDSKVKVDSEEVQRRQSSLIQVDLINGRHLSGSSITDEKAMARRSTLILKGKLDLDLEE